MNTQLLTTVYDLLLYDIGMYPDLIARHEIDSLLENLWCWKRIPDWDCVLDTEWSRNANGHDIKRLWWRKDDGTEQLVGSVVRRKLAG